MLSKLFRSIFRPFRSSFSSFHFSSNSHFKFHHDLIVFNNLFNNSLFIFWSFRSTSFFIKIWIIIIGFHMITILIVILMFYTMIMIVVFWTLFVFTIILIRILTIFVILILWIIVTILIFIISIIFLHQVIYYWVIVLCSY